MTAHSTLSGADLHETKGADVALSGQVLTADGAGSSSFQSPTVFKFIGLCATDSTTQTKPGVGVKKAITFDNNLVAFGVSHSLGSSEITLDNTGIYDLVIIPQLVTGGSGAGTAEVSWEVNTGTGYATIPGTPIRMIMGNSDEQIPICKILYNATAGHKVRAMWATNSTNIDIKTVTSLVGDTIPSAQVYVLRVGA